MWLKSRLPSVSRGACAELRSGARVSIFNPRSSTLDLRSSILVFTVLLFGACETVVDVAPPPHDQQLVAQGFFTPDSLWVVRVTHTVGYTSPEAPGFVDDATVEVWQEGQLRAQLACL